VVGGLRPKEPCWTFSERILHKEKLMRRRNVGLAALAAAVSLTACDVPPDPESADPAPTADGSLTIGSRGESVRAAHEYLARFGYLPNAELARSYPRWRPLVGHGPADPAVYDEHSAEAVRAFQSFVGLSVTGVIDGETRAFMDRPRCGVPEGIAPLDPADKFAWSGQKWNKTGVRWRVKNAPPGAAITSTTVIQVVEAAFDTWGANGVVLFPQNVNSPDIVVGFAKMDGPGGTLGATFLPNAGGDMTLDIEEQWTTDASPGFDLQTVVLHELGHALGLNHSGFNNAVMFPFNSGKRQILTIDDRVAYGGVYDTFSTLPGKAKDIAVATGGTPDLWIISDEPLGNGFRVKKFNGSGFDSTDGGAVRIAVGPDGIPWLVDSVGQIWRRTTTNPFVGGAWQLLPGRASDIGVGGDGTAWVIGVDSIPGGSGIHRFNGSFWVRSVDGAAKRIAVDEGGRPWVVNSSNRVFRRNSSDPNVSGQWVDLGGNATDVGVALGGQGRHTWAVGTSSGSLRLSVWNEQPFVGAGGGGNDAPRKLQFDMGKTVGAGGAGIAVTADINGRPFVLDATGTIFAARRQ
jgi:peptidoglycan hydrolase-like protein with peptidoglycan-binding domain